MRVGDILGWLVKRNVQELEHVFTPSELGREVEARQDVLERRLEDRQLRAYILRAQVNAMKGQAEGRA